MVDVPKRPAEPHSPSNHPQGPRPPQTRLATATLVLGILGLFLCPPAGLAAIITGLIALRRINSEPQRWGGRGMAIGGLVCGGGSLVLIPMWWAILGTSLWSRSTADSKPLVCQCRLKAIGTSMLIYEYEYPGQGTPPLSLLVSSGAIEPQQTLCPKSGLDTTNYVILPVSPEADGARVWAYEPKSNHGGEGGNILFRDGHATFAWGDEYDRLIAEALAREGG